MLNRILTVNVGAINSLNAKVIDNFSRLKLSLFLLPLFFLSVIALFLYSRDVSSAIKYIELQKNLFYFLNSKLSQFPSTIYNLTQFGDALIFLSLLTILIVYAPKVWESLISALLISAVFSESLKDLFLVPRPAAAFDNHTFVIIGRALPGYSSLPSGHSVTVFTILTVLLFAFMPKKFNHKFIWSSFIIIAGLTIAFTRVGVGAHYPLDVIVGSLIGYVSGLAGIFINRKYKVWFWMNNKKYYPIFILLFLISGVLLIDRIIDENLIIYYFALTGLIVSLYKVIYVYIKK